MHIIPFFLYFPPLYVLKNIQNNWYYIQKQKNKKQFSCIYIFSLIFSVVPSVLVKTWPGDIAKALCKYWYSLIVNIDTHENLFKYQSLILISRKMDKISQTLRWEYFKKFLFLSSDKLKCPLVTFLKIMIFSIIVMKTFTFKHIFSFY